MYQRKLKSFVLPLIYSGIIISFFFSIFLLQKTLRKPKINKDIADYDYVIKELFDQEIPVMASEKKIIRPYKGEEIKVAKHFYDYKAEAKQQEKSIIYYEKTYMQNSGIDYSGTKEFEATAILDGSIINVEEHNLLGNIVEIRHTNDFISIYQCLLDVKVKEGDSIEQGQLIGKSGICNITPDLKNHLHFEILYKGRVVDPETFYDKTVKEL